MKKVLFVCLFVAGLSTVSLAQGPQRRSPEEQAAALKTSLTLTDAQTAKVKAVYEAQAKSRDSLMQAGGDMQANMGAFMKMRETSNAKIKALLTPEQAAIFQKQVDEQAAQMRARMGN